MITFSPDGNCKSEDLPKLISKLKEGYVMLMDSRYLAPAEGEDDDLIAGFGNWLASDEPKRSGEERKLQILCWAAAYSTKFILDAFKKVRQADD